MAAELNASFEPPCNLEEKKEVNCQPDDISAFIISEEALQKVIDKNKGPPKPSCWKVFEKQENEWRDKEQCVEETHAVKIGIDVDSLDKLENSIKTISGNCRYPCEFGLPMLECYENNYRTPLKCRYLVCDYIQCLARYRETLYSNNKSTTA